MKTKEGEIPSGEETRMDQGTADYAEQTDKVNEQALPDQESSEIDPISKLEAQLSESQDRLLRLSAEFDNYRKRVSRDRIDQIKMAGADIFLSVLPVIDDFERALKSSASNTEAKPVLEGIQLIYNKLKSITESKGLKAMESIGKSFDPDLHDAITNIPAPSEELKGKVVEEVEKGYYLNDKVIRHAKVIVGI